MHTDFIEFISQLVDNCVDFIIVGAHALAFHGIPRYTGDIDILIYPSKDNAQKALKAIDSFFNSTLGLTEQDLLDDETIQFGRPPVRIDLLKQITGVSNDEVWKTKIKGSFGKIDVYYISKEMMIKNKKAAGRDKDALDVKILTDDK